TSVLSRNTPPYLPTYHSAAELVTVFMNFFTDKISKLCSSLNPVNNHFSSPHSFPPSIPPTITNFAPATLDEVRRAITSSSNATCPLDPISTHLLKSCFDSLILPITNIINLSLSNGIFPDTFKSAIVTPLYKKHSLPHDVLSSYRPISNLNFISKILERIIYSRFSDHLDFFLSLFPFQIVYLKFLSLESSFFLL